MNQFILAEFVFESEHLDKGLTFLDSLGSDFSRYRTEDEYDMESGGYNQVWRRITGKILAETATAIKMGDPFFSDRMKISYISTEMKHRYR